MIEISISSEMAAAHPRFIAGCAERGHPVDVIQPNASTADAAGGSPAESPRDSHNQDEPKPARVRARAGAGRR